MKFLIDHGLMATVMLLLPLTYWDAPLDPVLLPTFCLLCLAVVLLLTVLLFAGLKRRPEFNTSRWRSPVVLAYLSYLFFVGLSIFQAISFSEALFELARVSLIGILLLTLTLYNTSPSTTFTRFAKYATVTCLILSVIGYCQLYAIAFDFLIQHGIPAGTFANRGLFISYLCLLFPFTVFAAFQLRQVWRFAAAFASIATFVLIIISENRSSWISIIVAGAVAIFFLLRYRQRFEGNDRVPFAKHKFALIGVGVVALIIVTIALSTTDRESNLLDRARSIIDLQHESVRERLMIWDKTTDMALDNPLTGVGAGNCKIVFPAYGIEGTLQESGDVFFLRPHNDFLWMVSETGIGGLIAYLLFFIFALRSILVAARSSSSATSTSFAVASLFAITCYLVDSMFSFPKERITHLAVLTLIVALFNSLETNHSTNAQGPSHKMLKIALITLTTVCAFLFILGIVRLKSEVVTKSALIARENRQWQQVISDATEARSIFATLDPTTTPIAFYSGVAHHSIGEIPQALAEFERAYSDNPNHIHVLNNLATCRELTGDHSGAEAIYTKLLQIHPGFLEARLNLAIVHLTTGKHQKPPLNCAD